MKRAQVSIYIVLAVVLVVLIVFLIFVNRKVGDQQIPQNLRPVFDYYDECIKSEARTAINLAGTGGGKIFVEDYAPGSEYAPFSSHLNFLGSPVKYWYSLAGNGVIEENVPSLSDVEEEIARYVKEGVAKCDFEYYYSQGFNIAVGEPEVDVNILERKVEITVKADLTVSRADETATKGTHYVELDSKLGKFYNLAVQVYDEEKSKAFLEKYAVDVLYNYAPVDGVEIQCGPKIWMTREVMDSLRTGLQENFQTIKLKGDYYEINNKEREYFVYDKNVDESVNFLYFKDWPSRIEIYGDGADDDVMMAKPIGNDAGMGAMGFCYIPYHFIYDISFPVMVQLYDSGELFQFPLVVILDKSNPRKALPGEAVVEEKEDDLCQFMNQELEIHLYDANLNKADGNVSFECFNQKCSLGETTDGVLRTPVPACVNGYLFVRAGGFAEKKELVSTNKQNYVEVILDRERTLDVDLLIGGQEISKDVAIVSFTRDDGKVTSIAMPEQKEIKLSEGNYDVKVYVYGNASIKIPESTKTQCVESPRSGILGLFGSTKEECFDITIPATTIDNSLVGGGVLSTYLLDTELKKGKIKIQVDRLPRPTTLEQLSQNFEVFDTKHLWLEFDEK